MQDDAISPICLITGADYHKKLLQQIAAIERLVQPFDNWELDTVTGLIAQNHNHCWAVLNPNTAKKEEVVAYCIWSGVFEVAEILRIGTHPNHQRQGFAEVLLHMLIKQMANKGLEKILLEVSADNTTAIALYRKMGFKEIHRRVGYYSKMKATNKLGSGSCDALIMQYQR